MNEFELLPDDVACGEPLLSDSDPNLRHINVRGLYDSIKTLSEGSFESKLHAMENIWKTVPFLDPLPLQWEESVGLMFEKILNTQCIASSLCSPEESQKDMEQIVEATLKITSKLDDKLISSILQRLRKIAQIVRTKNLFELQDVDIEELNEQDVLKQLLEITKQIEEKLLPHDTAFFGLIESIEKFSYLCQEEIHAPENSKDMTQIVCATLQKLVGFIYDGAFFEYITEADKLFSDMEETLKKILTLARTKRSFSLAKAEETHYQNILEKVKIIVIHLNELHERLPAGEHLHKSLAECFSLCIPRTPYSAEQLIFSLDNIENAANAAIAAIEWPLLHLELFQYAKDLTLDFADLVFRRRVFNKCVSCLINECQPTSTGDLTDSKYLTNLFQVLQKGSGTEEGFQKRIEEVSKHAQEGYARSRLLAFWTTIESEAWELFDDGNLDGMLEELLKARAEKHAGDKTAKFLSVCIFGAIKHTLEQLSFDNLSTKTVIRKEFADACIAISDKLMCSNRQLSELIEVFNPRVGKPGNPAETICKSLTWGNALTRSTPSQLIFDLIRNFMHNFRANERHKKEEILLFLEEAQNYLLEKDGETKSSILLFPEQLYEINKKLRLLATFYFQQSNFYQFREIWEKLINLSKVLAPTTTGYFENSAIEAAIKNLSEFFLHLRPKELKPMQPITELCKLLDEILSQITFCARARDLARSFVYEMKQCLEDAFFGQEKDSSRCIFEQLIDISAHSLETVLIVDILPKAEVCLFVIKTHLVLLSFDKIVSERSEPGKWWLLLQKFQTRIAAELLSGDEAENITETINSSIERYRTLAGNTKEDYAIKKVYIIWESFKKKAENKFAHETDGTSSHTISFQTVIRDDIKSMFQETCEDLMTVYIHESTINDAKSLLENYRSLPSRSVLDLLEQNRSSLTRTTPPLKEDEEIADYFADMKSNFDKEDAQKCDEWADILRKVVDEIRKETKNAPNKNDRPSASANGENVALIMDYGKVYFLLRWDIREILRKLKVTGSLRFQGTNFELRNFLSNVTNLIEKLEKTSASEKLLLRFFAESEESENFNQIVEILNENNTIVCENSEKLREIMQQVCSQEDKYKGKRFLRVFWLKVKTMVEKEFKRMNPLKWEKLDNFRLSLEDYKDIRDKIFNMAEASLQQETWMEGILYALNHPISYLLQLDTVHFLSSRPKSSLSTAIALFGALFMLGVAFVMFGWSNMKNMIN